MTSMYIDYEITSKTSNIDLTLFFDGEITKVNKGDFYGRKKNISDFYEWRLNTKKIYCTDTNTVLMDFCKQFKKNESNILDILNNIDHISKLYIVINKESEEDSFSITISPQMISFLDSIGVELSIDGIYQ